MHLMQVANKPNSDATKSSNSVNHVDGLEDENGELPKLKTISSSYENCSGLSYNHTNSSSCTSILMEKHSTNNNSQVPTPPPFPPLLFATTTTTTATSINLGNANSSTPNNYNTELTNAETDIKSTSPSPQSFSTGSKKP